VPEQGDPEADRVQQAALVRSALRVFLDYEKHDDPETIQRAIKRLDQWARDQEPPGDWQLDPMVSALPSPYSDVLRVLSVDRLEFPNSDAFILREAVWLRDISNWARGDVVESLEMARHLFDWTIRNVQLDWTPGARGPRRPTQRPWETLLFGHGTATERAWLYILLLRQQGIDSGLIGLMDSDGSDQQMIRPWVVGVLIEGEVYLFDPTLGLPIPAPDGVKGSGSGPLEIQPATLAQVARQEGLLRQLDVEGEFEYPVASSQVQKVAALLEGSPIYLSRRMKFLESQLAGDDKVVLTAEPSVQAERFRECPQVAALELWKMPYHVHEEELRLGAAKIQWRQMELAPLMGMGGLSPMWKGRQHHFKGLFTGDETAITFYQRARPPNSEIEAAAFDPRIKAVLIQGKMAASYWLGLIAAWQGDTTAAVDWLLKRTVEYTPPAGPWPPNSPWISGARYNLGRVYEAEGQVAKAVETYRSNTDSPARHGELLRAQWLEGGAVPPRSEEGTAPGPSGSRPEEEAPKSSTPEKTEDESATPPAGSQEAKPETAPDVPAESEPQGKAEAGGGPGPHTQDADDVTTQAEGSAEE
jgi:hypothetical protein